MKDVPRGYVDLHSETKCGVFGICCLITLLAFCYVLYRLAVSPSKMPWKEVAIIGLSCAQLVFGIIFYFGSQHPFFQILNKAIKVAQSEIISWSCIAIIIANKQHHIKIAGALFNIFTAAIVIALVYGFFSVDVSTIYLNAKIGIFMSFMWFTVSMAVLYVAYKIRKKLDVLSLLRFDQYDQPLEMRGSEDTKLFGKATGDLVDSYSDTRFKQFMLLVIVESMTAVGTLVWDTIVYCSIHQNMNGKGLQLDMPILEEILYITSNIILMLIPNWAVFYVFYWVQRRNYGHVSSTWDINLNSIRFEVKQSPEVV